MIRIFMLVLALLFAVYTGIDAYHITSIGVNNGVAQLTGDGGGGMTFAVLLVIAAGLGVRFQRIGAAIFMLAAVIALWVGMIYQDSMMLFWAVGAVALCAVHVVFYTVQKRRVARYIETTGTRNKDAVNF